MGYELSIKRENENNLITKNEWSDYIKSDPEFEQIEEFSGEFANGDTLTVSTPNAGLWKSNKREVPFTFYEKHGEIIVKNPDNWITEKMISISENLGAIVEGQDGEKYDEEYFKDPFTNPLERETPPNEKKWWKFWK